MIVVGAVPVGKVITSPFGSVVMDGGVWPGGSRVAPLSGGKSVKVAPLVISVVGAVTSGKVSTPPLGSVVMEGVGWLWLASRPVEPPGNPGGLIVNVEPAVVMVVGAVRLGRVKTTLWPFETGRVVIRGGMLIPCGGGNVRIEDGGITPGGINVPGMTPAGVVGSPKVMPEQIVNTVDAFR